MSLNIVIPMAGLGKRFLDAGYTVPKPLIPVHGKPMIQIVVENLTPKRSHRFIFICQNEHIKSYGLVALLGNLTPNPEIIGIDGLTDGQISTVLKAREFINNNQPLMTANADQYIDVAIDDYLDCMDNHSYDGMIMTMISDHPKWSYAKTNTDGFVIETAEKRVISNQATVGIFNFRHGADLIASADAMIADDARVNGEFYTCPCYNYLLAAKPVKIGIYNIGSEYDGMYGLGTPSDLDFFLKHPVSGKVY
jgi:NDP-sugar pyrophosphorylase family protein